MDGWPVLHNFPRPYVISSFLLYTDTGGGHFCRCSLLMAILAEELVEMV